MEIACEYYNDKGIPVHAVIAGSFNSGDPVYICFDSRKDSCDYYKEYIGKHGKLNICGYATDYKKNFGSCKQEIKNES